MKKDLPVLSDEVLAAKKAGLHYVNDSMPGILRIRTTSGFYYTDASGQKVKDKILLERIKRLVIPPAWENVWICLKENGHLQVTGYDVKERKQYRYHPQWNSVRNENKFSRLITFAEKLPKIRERVNKDLNLEGLPKEKVIAVVIALLEKTLIRIGNEEYAMSNQTFGLTTLLDRHVDVEGTEIFFHFKAKSGKQWELKLRDKKLAAIVKKCRDIPGYDLFQYFDKNKVKHHIDSGMVNEYLHEIGGEEFSAKDFRTWGGTVYAAHLLHETGPGITEKERKKVFLQVIKDTAKKLGNTTTICKKYYIHPVIFESYCDNTLFDVWKNTRKPAINFSMEEKVVLKILKQKLFNE